MAFHLAWVVSSGGVGVNGLVRSGLRSFAQLRKLTWSANRLLEWKQQVASKPYGVRQIACQATIPLQTVFSSRKLNILLRTILATPDSFLVSNTTLSCHLNSRCGFVAVIMTIPSGWLVIILSHSRAIFACRHRVSMELEWEWEWRKRKTFKLELELAKVGEAIKQAKLN